MELIVNVTKNWGIGFENRLLVSISADLRRFRQLTEGKTVILGRKTLETFPGGRPANPALRVDGADIVRSEAALFARLRTLPRETLCVIGGASVYRMLLPYCDAARVTKTETMCEADAFFPDLDGMENWKITECSDVQEENGIRFQYIDYVNLTPRDFPTA